MREMAMAGSRLGREGRRVPGGGVCGEGRGQSGWRWLQGPGPFWAEGRGWAGRLSVPCTSWQH